ncbi:MAG: hypothetical protein JRH20_07225 [Deltaproteobacteria bacterium]|nr:hypothetical protein [Deltaproteobacteria bacterium]
MQPTNTPFSPWRRLAVIALTLAAMLSSGVSHAKGKSYAWVAAWPSRAAGKLAPGVLRAAIKTVGRQQVAKWLVKTPSGRLRFPAKRELPKKIIKKAVAEIGMQAVALSHDKVNAFKRDYRVEVPLAKSRKTSANQAASGRCWDFAGTLTLESIVKAKQGKDVKLSESFINYQALRRMAFGVLAEAVKKQPHKKRTGIEQLANSKELHGIRAVQKISEGGFAGWYYPLVRDHGLIPESAYGSNMPANHSSDYLGRVRNVVANALISIEGTKSKSERTKIHQQARKDVLSQLNMALGKPPKQFVVDGKRYTPQTYRKRYLQLQDADLDIVVLANDPITAFNRRYVVDGFPGMPEFEVHNVSMATINNAAKKTLRAGQAIYFSSIVSPGNPHVAGQRPSDPRAAKGLLSVSAFDYSFMQPEGARELGKRNRQKAGELRANHAMTLVGYNTKGGLRWLVQNSYGDKYGDHGRMHMQQDFFQYYGSSVAVPRAFVPEKILMKSLERPLLNTKRGRQVDL